MERPASRAGGHGPSGLAVLPRHVHPRRQAVAARGDLRQGRPSPGAGRGWDSARRAGSRGFRFGSVVMEGLDCRVGDPLRPYGRFGATLEPRARRHGGLGWLYGLLEARREPFRRKSEPSVPCPQSAKRPFGRFGTTLEPLGPLYGRLTRLYGRFRPSPEPSVPPPEPSKPWLEPSVHSYEPSVPRI